METVTNDSWISIPNLYDLAYRAHSNISFSPEKRAYKIVANYEGQLNDDLKNIPETERERYIEGYVKRLSSWLSAKSNCLSSMITGPTNFPVRKAERANRTEENRFGDFVLWRDKALKAIARKKEEAKPEEQKNVEQLAFWKEQVDKLFRGWLVDRFRSRLETVARTGNVELVRSVLNYFAKQQKEKGVVLATPRHGVWKLAEVAEKFRASLESVKTTESSEYEINGVKVVKNFQAERIQLFFDGKPAPEIISSLKHNAFKWSPSNMCWQRQLTQNAINATNGLLKSLA